MYRFTEDSLHVHNLFIIIGIVISVPKEQRVCNHYTIKIFFIIIAQAPRGSWALLVFGEFLILGQTEICVDRVVIFFLTFAGSSLIV